MTNVSFDNFLISFGHGAKLQKKQILKENTDKFVYMDLTCFDPQDFYDEFPQLKGSFSALFCDERKKIEIHFREKSQAVLSKFQEMGFNLVEISIVSCGFIFPRTVVQIINEAHYALEEGVATREDIDRAMKFGVNYPKGPFEWSKGREDITLTLLTELFAKTGDKRYAPSALLR